MTAAASSRQQAALRLLRRRLIQAVPLMLGVVVINFCLIQLAPGSFLDLMTAENQVSDPATVALLRKTYGLDDPVWLQLVKYIWALLQFDFGFSYRQNMPVIQAISVHLPATLLLMTSSIALALAVGVAAGVVASVKVRTVWDTLVSVAAMFFFAAPSFCDPALLDRPMLQHVLKAAGIPYIAFKYAENSGQMQPIREQAGTFADSIKLWSGQ